MTNRFVSDFTTENIGSIIQVSPRGSTLAEGTDDAPNPSISNGILTINFDTIDMGQKVVVTYTRDVPVGDLAISGGEITAITAPSPLSTVSAKADPEGIEHKQR